MIIVLVVVAVLAGGYFLFKAPAPAPITQNINEEAINTNPEITPIQNNTENEIDVQITVGKTYDVVYTDAGFSPATLAIKAGDTVNFKNESSSAMWVGSAMHPSHTVYSGTSLQQHCPDIANTSFDQCESSLKGTSWSFTFTKIGSWGYHNHSNSKHFGKITVE